MRGLDKISVLGLLLGVGAILLGQVLEGGHVSSLIQPTAFLIVVGGTMGAVMLQSPLPTFMAGLRMARWVFVPPPLIAEDIIERTLNWSLVARREGLLALEAQFSQLTDPFHVKGLQLLVDGTEPGNLREVLEVQIDVYEARMKLAARIWESAGGYSPTIGILGAVMGLIHVMENLTDPSRLGAGIAVAFVATIYGVGLANLVFLPMAKKLLTNIARLVALREMYVDGLVGIANGDNPRVIEGRMRGYVQ
ncbi:MAG: flagellar motor protein [Sterolibacterium sp.]|nr:flagellar motor protein [Sterolibacterium sp.]